MRTANLAVKFLLELGAFASFALWGWQIGGAVTGLILSVLAPISAIIVWGLWCAPRASKRLRSRWRAPLEVGIFLLAAAALVASGHPSAAAVFAAVVVANALGLTAFRQWEF